MPLPSTGALSASSINTEIGRSSTNVFSMNASDERLLAQKLTTNDTISFGDFYEKSFPVLGPLVSIGAYFTTSIFSLSTIYRGFELTTNGGSSWTNLDSPSNILTMTSQLNTYLQDDDVNSRIRWRWRLERPSISSFPELSLPQGIGIGFNFSGTDTFLHKYELTCVKPSSGTVSLRDTTNSTSGTNSGLGISLGNLDPGISSQNITVNQIGSQIRVPAIDGFIELFGVSGHEFIFEIVKFKPIYSPI